MAVIRSFTSRLQAVLAFDRSVYEEVEADPRALWQAVGIVAVAGAAQGVSPMFEAGWTPIAAQCVAGLLIWLFCSALIWNVSHRMLGYTEGFAELARVLGFAAAPLLGVWLTVLPIAGLGAWLSIVLHGLAFVNLVLATQTVLSTSTVRAVGICALSVAAGALLFFLLGIFLVGRSASEEIVAVLVLVLARVDPVHL